MPECAILLAGGRSRRMGRPKALLRIGDERLIAWQTHRLLEAGAGRVVIVAAAGIVSRVRRALATAPRDAWRVVGQPRPEAPPFDSLRRGLAAALRLRPAARLLWVLPVDVPAPSVPVFSVLRRSLTPRARAAVPTFLGRGGHPVLLRRSLASRIIRLDPGRPESRLDVILRSLPARAVRRVRVRDSRIHANANTPGSWMRLLRRLSRDLATHRGR
ncbi:MAG: nucleotidyltransferase family protein [Planctomycetes bacterium]|nr:nucleotidyltransferase family protein [Planctomycetota bacterium]